MVLSIIISILGGLEILSLLFETLSLLTESVELNTSFKLFFGMLVSLAVVVKGDVFCGALNVGLRLEIASGSCSIVSYRS